MATASRAAGANRLRSRTLRELSPARRHHGVPAWARLQGAARRAARTSRERWLSPGHQDARVRVLAAGAVARVAAVADLTAPARSSRHRRWMLALAVALSPSTGLAYTDVRLNGHEKLLFCC